MKLSLLTKYFLLTYLVSWTCFISVAVLSHKQESSNQLAVHLQVLAFLGTIAPSLVALWLTARTGVPGERKILLGKVLKWDVHVKWYLFAAGFMVLIKVFVALLHKIITGEWPQFGQQTWYIMLAAILVSTWVQAGEEIGWRGFALPRMSAKYGLAASALLLGIVWAFWHLPLFYVQGADTYGQSFPLYLMQVSGISVALGWLYWRTKGSLLLVMLMHAAINNTKGIVSSAVEGASNQFALSTSLSAWLTIALLWTFALYCLFQMRTVKYLE